MKQHREIHEIIIIDGRKKDFTGCKDCKYFNLPDDGCKAMGCIHAWQMMRDYFERETK